MLNDTRRRALDGQLSALLGMLDRPGPGGDITPAKEFERILESVTQKSEGQDVLGECLLRPGWREHWSRERKVYWAWFGDLEGDPVAGALYAVFGALAQHVLDSETRYRRGKHVAELRSALQDYLDRRGMLPGGDASTPTRAYCLLPPNRIRWKGEVPVEQRLWHLLGCLLDARSWPVAFATVEDLVWPGESVPGKRISNAVSDLGKALEQVGFPWIFRTKGAQILRE